MLLVDLIFLQSRIELILNNLVLGGGGSRLELIRRVILLQPVLSVIELEREERMSRGPKE